MAPAPGSAPLPHASGFLCAPQSHKDPRRGPPASLSDAPGFRSPLGHLLLKWGLLLLVPHPPSAAGFDASRRRNPVDPRPQRRLAMKIPYPAEDLHNTRPGQVGGIGTVLHRTRQQGEYRLVVRAISPARLPLNRPATPRSEPLRRIGASARWLHCHGEVRLQTVTSHLTAIQPPWHRPINFRRSCLISDRGHSVFPAASFGLRLPILQGVSRKRNPESPKVRPSILLDTGAPQKWFPVTVVNLE